jgi:hypothetical protein
VEQKHLSRGTKNNLFIPGGKKKKERKKELAMLGR